MALKLSTLTAHLHSPTKISKSHAAARLLMAILFLVSGLGKLGAPTQTRAYMEAYGVPGYLLYPAAALEIGGGGMLLADHNPRPTRWLASVLAGWCLLTAMIFHTDLKDQEQKINCMKNMAMAGGFLVLAEETKAKEGSGGAGGGKGSVDGNGDGNGSGQKVKWRPRWATWSEALAAGPQVFPDTKEHLDV
jgi:putative oxidoreductase